MENKGSKELFKEVVEQGLCTGCGACTSGCPYLTNFEGRSVLLDRCTITEGQCYKFCPRTYTDMNAINQKIFGKPYGADEIGVALDISLMRSTIPGVRERGQDGGTVTTLLALALEEGIIDAVISTKMNENKVPSGFVARNRQEILQCTGVSYAASFAMEAYNTMPKESNERLGIVGVGCQIEALAKMKISPPKNRFNIDHVKLSLGLFCGTNFIDIYRKTTIHPRWSASTYPIIPTIRLMFTLNQKRNRWRWMKFAPLSIQPVSIAGI
jgi:coenzyme F420 hydrogenase subunit beta